MKFTIKTYGCAQNEADSERISAYYRARGHESTENIQEADIVVANTCVIREHVEEKIFGFARNIYKDNPSVQLVITGCLIGAASREPSGKMMKRLRKRLPKAEFLPIEEVGFEYIPERKKGDQALIPISSGCNNYCAYCIVPFSRGKEISRKFEDILAEARDLKEQGFEKVLLLGQNVNSYGSDLLIGKKGEDYALPNGKTVSPVMVKHLNRHRIPTLFPFLLEEVAKLGFKEVNFMSSNPWDFSDMLISVIARNTNIGREIHLPIQSGDNEILKAMNRWYTVEEYEILIEKCQKEIPGVAFSTDIIVGFPGETEEKFENTVEFMKKMDFVKAYISCYSPRPSTVSAKEMEDILSWKEKKRRFHVLDGIVNKK